MVIANDITARKRAEEQLHREKEFAQITLVPTGDAPSPRTSITAS